MRRTPLRRTGSICRKTRLRAKGGSRFPKRRDPAYMAWLLEMLELGQLCDGECGRRATDRAHVVPKGSGGTDRGNVALVCRWCHRASEKRAEAFKRETGVDLTTKARAWTERYDAERA